MTDGRDEIRTRFEEAEDIDPDPSLEGPPPPEDPPGGPPGPAGDGAPPPEKIAAALPLNDVGNARRFVTYFGENLIHVPRVGWFVWTGQVWAKDPDDLAVRGLGQTLSERMKEEIRHVALEEWQEKLVGEIPALTRRLAEIKAIPEEEWSEDQRAERGRLADRLNLAERARAALPGKRKSHRAYANTSGNSDRITKAISEAGVLLARPLEALDADPLTVNCLNGLLRFTVDKGPGGSVSSVRLEPHDRAALQSKMIAAPYDPEARAPLFDAFLERIQPAGEMRAFLQRWFGLAMTALTGEQKLTFLYGHGMNGKSVLVDLMAQMLGNYAATAKIESLTGQGKRGAADATPDLIPLMGARFVRASEPEQGERLKESTIKELTGGEPILVRQLHADFVEIRPVFKLTISGNHKPDIRGTDDGIWRRLLLVPFDVRIPAEDRDLDLVEKLMAEAPGILRWLVDGLIDYLDGGLREPARVLEATQEYRADSDPIGTFLAECTVVSGEEGDFILSRELIEAFNWWREQRGESAWSRAASVRFKEKAGHWRHPTTGRSYEAAKRTATGYRGIKLTDTFAREFSARSQGGQGRFGDDRDDEDMPL